MATRRHRNCDCGRLWVRHCQCRPRVLASPQDRWVRAEPPSTDVFGDSHGNIGAFDEKQNLVCIVATKIPYAIGFSAQSSADPISFETSTSLRTITFEREPDKMTIVLPDGNRRSFALPIGFATRFAHSISGSRNRDKNLLLVTIDLYRATQRDQQFDEFVAGYNDRPASTIEPGGDFTIEQAIDKNR